MKDKKKIIATRLIEPNLDLYDSYFDHAWATTLSEQVHPKLSDAVDGLCLAWKEAANTHRMPWLMIHQMEAFAGSFMRGSKSNMGVLCARLRDWLFRELDGTLRRVEKRAINAAIKKLAQRVRLSSEEKGARFPAREYWSEIASQPEIVLSITGSQNLSYCALDFAYEWFVVSCFRALGGDDELRPAYKKFWLEFAKLLGGDPRVTYWDDHAVMIAREARNSIAHLGGKAKSELIAMKPNLFISEEGMIAIRPSDNRSLFELLKGKVDRLVVEVTPKL